MSTSEISTGENKSRPFALGGQGVKPKFNSDAPAAPRRGFSLTGGLAAAPAAPEQTEPGVEPEFLPAPEPEPAREPEPVTAEAPVKAAKPATTRAAKPAKAAGREPVESGTKILNTSIPAGLFAALDDASSGWFAANGALARRSGARKSLNTFTIAVLALGLQAVKDSDPEDVAAFFPPIRR